MLVRPGCEMSRFFLIGFALLGLQSMACAQGADEVFTIYLVRHAERESEAKDPGNPVLTSCGELRADSIARVLSDIDLEKVYSTSFERTLGTARPSAESRQLEIDIYDPRKLGGFSALLLEKQQNALVVGHSDTTGVLAGLLADESGVEFAEDIYDRVYQVVILNGQGYINLFHQAFNCGP